MKASNNMNIIKKTSDKWKKDPVVKFGLYSSKIIITLYVIIIIYLTLSFMNDGYSTVKDFIGFLSFFILAISLASYVPIFPLLILTNIVIFIYKRKDVTWHSLLLSLSIVTITYLTIILSIICITNITN